jgi:hypothetical protein
MAVQENDGQEGKRGKKTTARKATTVIQMREKSEVV